VANYTIEFSLTLDGNFSLLDDVEMNQLVGEWVHETFPAGDLGVDGYSEGSIVADISGVVEVTTETEPSSYGVIEALLDADLAAKNQTDPTIGGYTILDISSVIVNTGPAATTTTATTTTRYTSPANSNDGIQAWQIGVAAAGGGVMLILGVVGLAKCGGSCAAG